MRFSTGLAALALLATATAKDDAVPDVKDVVVDAISEGQEQQTEEESLVASTVKAADDATDEGTSQEAALKAALGGEDESGSEQTEAEKEAEERAKKSYQAYGSQLSADQSFINAKLSHINAIESGVQKPLGIVSESLHVTPEAAYEQATFALHRASLKHQIYCGVDIMEEQISVAMAQMAAQQALAMLHFVSSQPHADPAEIAHATNKYHKSVLEAQLAHITYAQRCRQCVDKTKSEYQKAAEAAQNAYNNMQSNGTNTETTKQIMSQVTKLSKSMEGSEIRRQQIGRAALGAMVTPQLQAMAPFLQMLVDPSRDGQ